MIPLPVKPKITDKKQNGATFVIEGLYPGYGVTIGNALRRVLLSSLEGAAITQMKIKGVRHEFSTIPGVLEDAITIMLNLKQLRFKLHTDEPQKGHLLVKGQKEAKGSDFQLPSQVELINGNVTVASLSDKKSELDIEIRVEKGIGYQPAETRKKDKLEIGAIAVDAIFTPVRKVSFRSENMRVGERTDFDRLYLELETDGTISPEEAFVKASEFLVEHFSLLKEGVESEISKSSGKEKPKASLKAKAGKKESRTKQKTVKSRQSSVKTPKTKKQK